MKLLMYLRKFVLIKGMVLVVLLFTISCTSNQEEEIDQVTKISTLLFLTLNRTCTPAADTDNYGGCSFMNTMDSSGLNADDIPVANTPITDSANCGYSTFPEPVLKNCTEPLTAGVSDLRGLWENVSGPDCGHVERIEQCGNRVVITSGGVIHDMRTDGTLANGVNDINPKCQSIHVAASFVEGRLELSPDAGSVMVSRWLEGDELVWNYGGFVFRMRKICD